MPQLVNVQTMSLEGSRIGVRAGNVRSKEQLDSTNFRTIVTSDVEHNQEPKEHPNISFRVGYPYLIVLIKEGILGYPNLMVFCLGPFLGPYIMHESITV